MQRHLAAESKSSVRCRFLQALISTDVQLIADIMVKLSVLKLGQKLLPFRRYALLLTKYARREAYFFSKALKFGKHSLRIDTSFATMSDPHTPNLEFIVQATTHYTLLTTSYTLNTTQTTLHLGYGFVFRYSFVYTFACSCIYGYSSALSYGYC